MSLLTWAGSSSAALSLQAVASLLRTRDIVQQHIARVDGERITAMLYAASHGDTSTVRQVSCCCGAGHAHNLVNERARIAPVPPL